MASVKLRVRFLLSETKFLNFDEGWELLLDEYENIYRRDSFKSILPVEF